MKTKQIKQKEIEYEPMCKYLLVTRDETEKISEGGLFLPEVARRKLNEGTIKAISKACLQSWSVGDRIIFNDMGALEVKPEEGLVMLNEDMVYVKVK